MLQLLSHFYRPLECRLFGKSKIAQEAAALHLSVLAQLPFDPKAAQLCDEGNIEAVENPLMADAARAVAGQVGL